MNRRDFIKGSALMAAGVSLPAVGQAGTVVPSAEEESKGAPQGKLIDSAPMLQNFAQDSVGVAFGVSDKANGYVIYGERPDLSDGRKVVCGGYRVTAMNDKVMQVRLTGLKPATTYYYKVGADRIHYGGGYDMKVLATEEDERVYSFTTAGAQAKGHFCVINDTHASYSAFDALTDKIAHLMPSCVVWNGDTCNVEETIDDLKKIILKPAIERKDYAARIPFLLSNGNHDFRGMGCRHFEQVWMYRQPEERLSRDWDLGRNFAVRLGDVALIGLDTAEDKVDENPLFAGLIVSHAYRRAQRPWLEYALSLPEIKSAPYLVAFCHIPLFDDDPRMNPGDVHPNDTDKRYSSNFAAWQRECAQLWGDLLTAAGCQLVISAHQHNYRYMAPAADRSWGQMIGGGPDMKAKNATEQPTVIEGKVEADGLHLRAYNVSSQTILDEQVFAPRKVKKLKARKP